MKLLMIGIVSLLMTGSVIAQKSLCIDLYRLGHFKRLHIYQHQVITYKLKDSRYTYRDTLADMAGDSTLVMADGESVRLSQISLIKIDRSNWLLRKLYRTGIIGGIFIVAIDAANNIGNERPTVVDKPFIIAGASMVAAGFILKYACTRRIRPGKHTVIRIIDISPR